MELGSVDSSRHTSRFVRGPPSERPFGFVFRPGRGNGRLILDLLAFGERHPQPGSRSVYERAHKRLHGRYPDQ